MTIHRDTNYIEFIAGVNTNACNAHCKYEAWKDSTGRWHVYDSVDGKSYLTTITTLRHIIKEIIVQANADLPLSWRLAH